MDELLDLSTQFPRDQIAFFFLLLTKSPKSNDANKNLQSHKKEKTVSVEAV